MPLKTLNSFIDSYSNIFRRCGLVAACTLLLACQQQTDEKKAPTDPANISKPLVIANLKVINAAISTGLAGDKSRPTLLGGSSGTILYRTDQEWRAANSPDIFETIMGFCTNDDGHQLVAVGSDGLLASSADDGKNWKKLSPLSRSLPSKREISKRETSKGEIANTETLFDCRYDKAHKRWLLGGDGGPLLYSDDLQGPWQRSDTAAKVTHLYATRGDNLLLGTGPEFVGSSSDGGEHWSTILSLPGAMVTGLLDLKTHLIITTDQGKLWRTADMVHWDEIAIQPDSAIFAIAEDTHHKTLSLITSFGDIFISDDQGAHWGVSFHAASPLVQLRYSATHKRLLAAGSSGIFYSDNGGRVWQQAATDFNDEINFLWDAPEALLAFGLGGFTASSLDGGTHWQMQRPAIADFIHQVKPVLDKSLLLTGANGLLMRSTDGGESWQRSQASISTQDFLFSLLATKDAQFAAGSPGTILRSRDKGKHWQTLLSLGDPNKGYFHKIISDEQQTLLAIAGPGTSYYSTNNGDNWQPISTANTQHLLNAIYDKAHRQFIALGNGGTILRSRDGREWEAAQTNTEVDLQGVAAVGETLFASGGQGTLLRSVDGGKTWQALASHTQTAIQHIVAINDSTLLATGLNGLLLRSTDLGDHWQTISPGETANLREPVVDSATGIIYISSRSGIILSSKDAGLTWSKLPQVTQESIKGIYIDNARRTLVGYGARLIRIPLAEP